MANITIYDLIEQTKQVAREAKVDSDLAREASKADSQNRQLRIEAEHASYKATEAGRKVAEYEFLARILAWQDSDEPADELLLSLAPRVNGRPDWDWVAAAHLARSGVKVPSGWRSEISQEGIHDHFNNSDARSAV
jgi:hypothetical protein